MADSLRTELITRDFSRMLEDLASIDPTIEFSAVVTAEAISVVGSAMSKTKAATVSAINKREDSRKVLTFGGKAHFISNHWPDYLWSEIQRLRKEHLQTKLGARGLAKQTWFNLASKIGGNIAAPAYVMAANYRGQQYAQNVSEVKAGSAADFSLTIKNDSPLGPGARMENALLNAMNGRARYFEKNMEHRAFATLASRAAKYPGIYTSPVPPRAD
jgi:hypothetical protein